MRLSPPRIALLTLLASGVPLPAAAQLLEADARMLALPRLEADAQVDGLLDEAVWAEAAVLRGFFQYLPTDGRPAADSTVVHVWYAPTALYFGIRAYARGGQVRATLADRDRIEGDDYLLFVLDPFDDQRQAFVFGVNPLGIQADGILRDAVRAFSTFNNERGNEGYTIDWSPDYVYASKGRVTPFGYEVEVRIPFKSLRYPAAAVQDWRLNVLRRVQYTGYEDTWSPVLQQRASFLAQCGTLEGLTDLRRGLVLDLNPEATASVAGAPSAAGWAYDAVQPELGGNVRWGVTSTLSLGATVNPDFSQVEADVPQLQFDPRFALFFPEKRPFFLDGIELFSTPNTLIYTRRVVDPVGAVKLTGKAGRTSIAALSAADRGASGAPGGDHAFFNIVRLRRDLGEESAVGMAYTDRVEGDAYNRVAALDGQFVLDERYTVVAQGALSATRPPEGRRTTAPLWTLTVSRAGRRAGFRSGFTGVHPRFEAQSGFLRRQDIVQLYAEPRLSAYSEEGSFLENWNGTVYLDGTWKYDDFVDATRPGDVKLHLNNNVNLRGGWQVGASFLVESFKYPAELYTNYVIERTEGGVAVDTVAFAGTPRIANYDVVGSLRTPRFQRFSGSVSFIYGRDVNFSEWASATILFLSVNAEWRPTEQLRVNLLYNHQQYVRPSDGSNVSIRRVPRLKVEYQLTRALFVRFVGQYDAFVRDALRDDRRTYDPILIYDPAAGTYARTEVARDNALRFDWLVSYRPTPGTVFFLGYGSSLREDDTFRFAGLDRTADGFFVKLSYLFRVQA